LACHQVGLSSSWLVILSEAKDLCTLFAVSMLSPFSLKPSISFLRISGTLHSQAADKLGIEDRFERARLHSLLKNSPLGGAALSAAAIKVFSFQQGL
jgi:hypothetical protein